MEPIYNPTIPCSRFIASGFGPGRMVRIQGSIPLHSKRFSIDLACGQNSNESDIGLHLSARFHENVLVRNSKLGGTWSHEERHGHLPLTKGQHFEIIILCELYQYKIALNGQHYTDFAIRLPSERVTHLEIDGEVTVSLIQFEGSSSNFSVGPPPPQPVMSMSQPQQTYPSGVIQPMGWAPMTSPSYPVTSGQYQYPPPPPPPTYNYSPYQPSPNSAYAQPAYPPPQEYAGYGGQVQGQQQGKMGGGKLVDNAMKQVQGILTKVGLEKVVNKIPGGHQGQPKWT